MRKLPRPSIYDLGFDAISDVLDESVATRTYRRLYVHRRPPDGTLDRVRTATGIADTRPCNCWTPRPVGCRPSTCSDSSMAARSKP